MLQLKNITKGYKSGDEVALALDNVSISFREAEFVSILGASGSGKTTMLNIIGGLDKYSSGDLIVNGTSTKQFKDRDWDSYRNGTIGFVFQSYNLINHLSVLENVKLALSISGNSSKDSTEKAKSVLKEVGLEKHIYKKPTQLSGGQMQRVAIARALVTDPKIILADEPTGALDSKTSVQIMELIKKISRDKLVIMVTHNPELAEKYSDRIVRVADGKIFEDTNKYEENKVTNNYVAKKTAMSLGDAIKSSMKNLLTKKVRTILTTFAGSIGIISIALVLSISAGMQNYISKIENENLSSMPITISADQMNVSFDRPTEVENNETTEIKSSDKNEVHKNVYTEDKLGNGETFIKYLENNAKDYYKGIDYGTNYVLKTLTKNKDSKISEVKLTDYGFRGNDIYNILSEDKSVLLNQYDIVAKLDSNFEYPTKANELILFVDRDNSVDKNVLKALGYDENAKLEFKDLLGKEVSVVSNDNYYKEQNGFYRIADLNNELYDSGVKAKIVAIVKPNSSNEGRVGTSIGYTKALENEMLAKERNSKIVEDQKKDSSKNVLTKETITTETYDQLVGTLGGSEKPANISIYPKTFADRENIVKVIDDYNKKISEKYGVNSADAKKYSITYTDMAKMATEMMSSMINAITVILTAFAAISLIVSSVMIGILTYVSVVERTKEIGILRAIGARKKDITRIFNAEAGIIGVTSGLVGVVIAVLLNFPINKVIAKSLSLDSFSANLSLTNTLILVGLSLFLTLIASIIPARMAAKKNPVEALRTE